MKRVVFLVILAVILAGLLLLGLSDTVISTARTSIPDNEVVGSILEADNIEASWIWQTVSNID